MSVSLLVRCTALTCYTLGRDPWGYPMRRREFIALVGSGVAGWRLAARAQPTAMPFVSFMSGRSSDGSARFAAAFQKGLSEIGYADGQNVRVEYHWLEGQYHRIPSLMADAVHRRAAVIAVFSNDAALAAKSATITIPIVFGASEDPVKLGLVDSIARPGGNATGINFLFTEVVAKRLGLLHDLVPKAVRIAVLVNPANASNAEATLREVQEAARAIGLEIVILNASTSREIEAAFATLVRDRADALFVAPDGFFASRRVQFAILASHHRIPASYSIREYVEAGALMSYGPDLVDMFRQVGVHAGRILKGAKPADLPVVQSSKFEFVINLQAARALGIEVPNALLLVADETIE
jgi:putative tryptophan/tyrosine transport system substrate-binding protein